MRTFMEIFYLIFTSYHIFVTRGGKEKHTFKLVIVCTAQLLVLVAIAVLPECLNTIGVCAVAEVTVVTLHHDGGCYCCCFFYLPASDRYPPEGGRRVNMEKLASIFIRSVLYFHYYYLPLIYLPSLLP